MEPLITHIPQRAGLRALRWSEKEHESAKRGSTDVLPSTGCYLQKLLNLYALPKSLRNGAMNTHVTCHQFLPG